MKEIYLDNNATTRVDETVFEETRPYFCELYGNPGSMHFFGGQVQRKVDEARERVAANELMARIPNARVNGGAAERLPNTLNIAFEFVEGEAILLLLNELGICASSGSACTSGSLEPSHVLRAMGVPFTCAHGSVRFSLSRYTTGAEVDAVVRELPPIIARLRQMSPFGKDKDRNKTT